MKALVKTVALLVAIAPATAMAQSFDIEQFLQKKDQTLFEVKEKTQIFNFDYSIPASPALALAGLSPDKTATSSSLKPFVVALPDFLSGSGEGQSMALDFSPAANLIPKMTYGEYSKFGDFEQALYRSRIGAALYRGVDDPDPTKIKASRLAIGYSTSLLGNSDPFFARRPGVSASVWETCAIDAIKNTGPSRELINRTMAPSDEISSRANEADSVAREILRAPDAAARQAVVNLRAPVIDSLLGANASQGDPVVLQSKLADKQKALDGQAKDLTDRAVTDLDRIAKGTFGVALQGCVEKANAEARSGLDLDFGIGALWNGRPDSYEGFGKANGAIWLAGRAPLYVARDDMGTPNVSLMIGGVGRYAWREAVATGDATTPIFLADTWDAWAGLELLSADMKVALQYGWFDAEARDRAQDKFSQSGERWLVTGAVRLAKYLPFVNDKLGAWGNVSYGVANGTTDARDDKKVLVTLTFAPPTGFGIFN